MYIAVNFLISVNFYFSFVLDSLAYTIKPKNNGKLKIKGDKKLTTTYLLKIQDDNPSL